MHEMKQNARVLKIPSISSPCILRPSPRVPGIPRTTPTLKRRTPLAHATLLPMGPDVRKTSTQWVVEGASPVDAHLPSAYQILFATLMREGRNTVYSWLRAWRTAVHAVTTTMARVVSSDLQLILHSSFCSCALGSGKGNASVRGGGLRREHNAARQM